MTVELGWPIADCAVTTGKARVTQYFTYFIEMDKAGLQKLMLSYSAVHAI